MAFKFKYVGWQVGISYQCPDRAGLNRDYVRNLLDEMHKAGMNLISFMMVSHEINDPLHDGYTWPVRNPRLRCYIDEQVLNAQQEHEFLRTEIEYASGLGFHVQLFTNNFWWNHRKAVIGYPHIAAIQSDDPHTDDWHHLARNKDTWAMACDEVSDLLGYYHSSSVNSYGWEMMGNTNNPDWKETLKKFTAYIRSVRPNLEVWHHGYYGFHEPRTAASYQAAGIDVVFPVIHNVVSEEQLREIMDSSGDVPFVLHVDVRDKPTRNYPVPAKNVEYIEQMGEWLSRHLKDNFLGVMFFNQVHASKPNQQAVLRVIERWRKMGLM